jgi:hypothetical protein
MGVVSGKTLRISCDLVIVDFKLFIFYAWHLDFHSMKFLWSLWGPMLWDLWIFWGFFSLFLWRTFFLHIKLLYVKFLCCCWLSFIAIVSSSLNYYYYWSTLSCYCCIVFELLLTFHHAWVFAIVFYPQVFINVVSSLSCSYYVVELPMCVQYQTIYPPFDCCCIELMLLVLDLLFV